MQDRMKKVSRGSISDEFEIENDSPIPPTPPKGARIKVLYAGACFTSKQVKNSVHRRLRMPGVHDTSLFPGYEVAGIVDEVSEDAVCDVIRGDRVVVFSADAHEQYMADGTFAEYITTSHPQNLVKVPLSLRLDVASQLPSGALMAYSAITRIKPFIGMRRLSEEAPSTINILIVGAGVLGQWTVKMAQYYISDMTDVQTTVADTSVDKLRKVKSCGSVSTVEWDDSLYEQHLIERTKDVCRGGVDIVIDYVSTPRSIHRAINVLKEDGVLLVGGTSHYEVSICLDSLAQHNHSIIGIRRGSRQQLAELVEVFSKGLITPPEYSIHPVNDANEVFADLTECKIPGRAVFKLGEEE